MKKLLSLTLAFCLALALLPAAADIDGASEWAREGVAEAIAKGFVPPDIQGGYAEAITRAEFCRMAVKWIEIALEQDIDAILTERALARDPAAFTDTDDSDILAAYALGVTQGVGDGRFNPDGVFDREQAATMIRNVCAVLGADTDDPPDAGFSDMANVSGWAQSSVNFAGATGIMKGTGGSLFSPQEPYSREQSIVTFNNIHPDDLPKAPDIPEPPAPPEPSEGMTAANLVASIRMGWNLGNTFDAFGGRDGWSWLGGGSYANMSATDMERAWVNHVTTRANIDALRSAGFNAIRIPVTWFKACDADYNIRADWMSRVKEVVDYAVANDMVILLNTHHDEEIFKLLDAQMTETKKAFEKIWTQIAEAFKDYDHNLIFESLNEPRTKGTPAEWNGGTAEERANLNALNQLFVDTVRRTGGSNAGRVLLIPTYGASAGAAAMRGLVIPKDTAEDRIAVSIHAYVPWNFALRTDGGTASWSRDNPSDTRQIHEPLDLAYELFVSKGIPVVMGEMGALNKDNLAARVAWAEYYTAYAKSKGIPCFWWDNGASGVSTPGIETFGLLDRRTNQIISPEIVAAMLRGTE